MRLQLEAAAVAKISRSEMHMLSERYLAYQSYLSPSTRYCARRRTVLDLANPHLERYSEAVSQGNARSRMRRRTPTSQGTSAYGLNGEWKDTLERVRAFLAGNTSKPASLRGSVKKAGTIFAATTACTITRL